MKESLTVDEKIERMRTKLSAFLDRPLSPQ
jgi:hypothetical protein